MLGGVLVGVVSARDWDPWQAPRDKAAGRMPGRDAAMARLVAASDRLRADGSPRLEQQRLDGVQAPAELKVVAILADFADTCFYGREAEFPGPLPTSTQSDFYYAAHDSLYYAHLLRDVADYFAAVSSGRFTLDVAVHGTVAGLSEVMAFYGDHPDQGEQSLLLARDAIGALDGHVDFSAFDTVILIHAGAGEETDVLGDSPEQIYSTYLGPEDFERAVADSSFATPYIPTDDFPEGDGVRHVLILPENEFQDVVEGIPGYYGSLGVYCFEVGLRLGMLSLTDFTPAGSPDSQGIGQFCLMGYGLFSAGGNVPPHPCAFNKQLMGWLAPYRVEPDLDAEWTLLPSEQSGDPRAAARIELTGAEYYLLEYRLQDPDGNAIFSFDGDLNHNNVPDFYDASNDTGGYVPAGWFDPAEDTRERFTGAEWDFFLSDNLDRPEGVKGAGSGIYVWHIDEGVIREAFGQERNLFNADPQRKSVDLEEADGVQDLDRREPSPYWQGADDDSFRGEGAARFGPDTRPDTRTNGQVPTGLVVADISFVVADSAHVFHEGTADEYAGILYADSMSFACRRQDLDPPAELIAARDLVGVDFRGSHLLAAPLAAPGGEPVVVAAADSGRIFAWTPELAEWVDHDGVPETFAPLAVATGAGGEGVRLHLPLAVGQLDPDDPGLEIVATAPEGIYAFRQDGAPLSGETGPTDHGLLAALTGTSLPPILLPAGDDEGPAAPVVVCTGTVDSLLDPASTELRFVGNEGVEVRAPVRLDGTALAPPVRSGRVLYVAVVVAGSSGRLHAVSWPATGDPEILWTVDLDLAPGTWPPLVTPTAVLATSADGRGQTVRLSAGGPVVGDVWPAAISVESPLGAGGTFVGGARLGRVAEAGIWQQSWPRQPLPAIQSGGAQPLAAGDPDDPAAFVFTTRDGRIYLAGPDGTTVAGWPIAGPADGAATPVLLAVPRSGESPDVLLAAAGTTPQITGVDPDAAELGTAAVSRLRTWRVRDLILPLGAPNSMYGVTPWRGGAVGDLVSVPAGGPPPLADNHVCYPQPLVGDLLRVRGFARADGDARAVILNLQGEEVRDTGTVWVQGRSPFELEIDMRGVASGLYLCKLEAGGETSVRTVAVAR